MKKENYIIITLSSILFVVILLILVKNYITYKHITTISKNPFNTIEVLGQKIRLKDNTRTYKLPVECKELSNENNQIIYYRLDEKYKDSKITVSSKILKDNKLLIDDYKGATNLEFVLSVLDSQEDYEQIFHISATCNYDNEEKEDNTTSKDKDNKKNNDKKPKKK